jgi:hypothetical protein
MLSLASIAAFLRADPALFGTARADAPEQKTSVPVQDQALLARLMEVLERDEVWRREALGIRELASIVDAPEHRLRKLINEGLGYRNFAAFLNERRIAAQPGGEILGDWATQGLGGVVRLEPCPLNQEPLCGRLIWV